VQAETLRFDLMLLHHALEAAPVHSRNARAFRDVAFAPGEVFHDETLFKAVQDLVPGGRVFLPEIHGFLGGRLRAVPHEDLMRDMLQEQLLGLGEKDHPLHHVLQLPDIPRPLIPREQLGDLGGELPDVLAELQIELADEMLRQDEDVLPPVPEGGHDDGEGVYPEIEVFPEMPRGDRGLEVPVGRDDDPHVHADVLRAAEAPEALLL